MAAPRKGALILDSFAGSGTTAHAVLAANKKDGGHRKFGELPHGHVDALVELLDDR